MTKEDLKTVEDFMTELSEQGVDEVLDSRHIEKGEAERLMLKTIVYMWNSLKGKKSKSIIDDFIEDVSKSW